MYPQIKILSITKGGFLMSVSCLYLENLALAICHEYYLSEKYELCTLGKIINLCEFNVLVRKKNAMWSQDLSRTISQYNHRRAASGVILVNSLLYQCPLLGKSIVTSFIPLAPPFQGYQEAPRMNQYSWNNGTNWKSRYI